MTLFQNAPTHFYYIFNSLNTHRETTELGSVFYSTTIIMYMQFSSNSLKKTQKFSKFLKKFTGTGLILLAFGFAFILFSKQKKRFLLGEVK